MLNYIFVLGSARTGLIFTRIQEGTQPGGLTQPGQTEQGIPYHVPSCWVPVGGELEGGNSVVARERTAVTAAVGESGSVRFCCLFCVFSLSVSLLLLFPLFAVLLNCPYPDPPVSAYFFPFSSAPQRGGGAATWRFCCRPQPNYNNFVYYSLQTQLRLSIVIYLLIYVSIPGT